MERFRMFKPFLFLAGDSTSALLRIGTVRRKQCPTHPMLWAAAVCESITRRRPSHPHLAVTHHAPKLRPVCFGIIASANNATGEGRDAPSESECFAIDTSAQLPNGYRCFTGC